MSLADDFEVFHVPEEKKEKGMNERPSIALQPLDHAVPDHKQEVRGRDPQRWC